MDKATAAAWIAKVEGFIEKDENKWWPKEKRGFASGLALPSAGEIIYDGKNVAKIDRYTFRSKCIGVVFQSFNLLTKYTAMENVILSMDVAALCDERYELVKISNQRK